MMLHFFAAKHCRCEGKPVAPNDGCAPLQHESTDICLCADATEGVTENTTPDVQFVFFFFVATLLALYTGWIDRKVKVRKGGKCAKDKGITARPHADVRLWIPISCIECRNDYRMTRRDLVAFWGED